MDNNYDNAVVTGLTQFQNLFNESVDQKYREGNEIGGDTSFEMWEDRFLQFLKTNLPEKVDIYKRLKQKHHSGKISGLNVYENWRRGAGDIIDAFLEQLIEETKNQDNHLRELTGETIVSKRNVFVVHGRNIMARDEMFHFLRSIDLNPIEWSKARKLTEKPSPYIGKILDAAFQSAQAIIVLMTPDELAMLKEEYHKKDDPEFETNPTSQPRPNVLFEAGMAMGRHPDRIILVKLGYIRPFSDISGLHIVQLTNSPEKRKELADRLEDAGCAVDRSGTDWLNAGKFEEALNKSTSEESTKLFHKASQELTPKAVQVIKEASKDNRGLIRTRRIGVGLLIEVNDKDLVTEKKPREETSWEEAITQLVDHELIYAIDDDNQIFKITSKGFDFVDNL